MPNIQREELFRAAAEAQRKGDLIAAGQLYSRFVQLNPAVPEAWEQLGAIFAEPSEVGTRADRSSGTSAQIIPFNLLPNSPWNRGGYYYGSSWSYDSGPYYGGPYQGYATRLPYVCGLYGYCF